MDWWHGIGRRLAIDVVNTAPDAIRGDVLAEPGSFAEWLRRTGAPAEVGQASLVLVRKSLLILFEARLARRPLPRRAVAAVNTLARSAPLVPQLERDALVYVADASPEEAFLGEIAISAIELVGGGREIRGCAGSGCRRFVVGRAQRRWCCDRCGNRHRVAGHRARRRARDGS